MTERDEYRLGLVKDSLIGTRFRLSDPKVFFLQFLNHILLLFQRPLIFAFWEHERRIYSSLKDPGFLKWQAADWEFDRKMSLPLPGRRYRMTIHGFMNKGRPEPNHKAILRIDRKATQIAEALFSGTSEFRLPKELMEFLVTGFESSLNTDTPQASPVSEADKISPLDLDYSVIKKHLNPLRNALDDIFEESIRSKNLFIDKGALKYPNIFSVVRTYPSSVPRYKGMFRYTAGILLFSEMRNALFKWCGSKCASLDDARAEDPVLHLDRPEACAAVLEHPLGLNSRSVADLVFSSGIIDFGRQASEPGLDVSVAGDPLDEQRRAVEKCIYPEDWRLLYMPVHVGGTPWLSLFTFTPKNPALHASDWHHNYGFYRDLAQPAAALIRERVQEAYEILVAKKIVKHLESKLTPIEELIGQVNRSLQELAQVYPFSMVIVESPATTARRFYAVGRGVLGLKFIPNPFFPRQVNWMVGSEEAIYQKCKAEVNDFTDLENTIDINATAQTSHLLKSPLRRMESILTSDNEEWDKLLHRQVRKVLELHDFASALLSEKKRNELIRPKWTTLQELARDIQGQYEEMLTFLSESAVSGNLASKLQNLINTGRITFDCNGLTALGDVKVAVYDLMFETVLDGLVTNALDSVDLAYPKIEVRLTAVKGQGGYQLFLEVENTTALRSPRLEEVLQRLNSPGPDLVGISEIHWVSQACWPGIDRRDRLEWTARASSEGVISITARALIGEEQK